MLNSDQLADLLKTQNVERISELSGLSQKTIYRLRNKQHSPSLKTVERVLMAVAGKRWDHDQAPAAQG